MTALASPFWRYKIKVASLQYRAVPSDKARNIESLSEMIREASENGARIIVLPELCTTGLHIESRDASEVLAETIPGPATDAFARLALHHKVYLVLGLAEIDRSVQKYYNSQVILGPDGVILGKYRKVHLFGPDLNWAQIGDLGYRFVSTQWGRIGMGICCDINYWELIDFLSAAQVHIFAFSANWVGDELPFAYWSEMVAGRSYYLIAANNWGTEGEITFSGGSMILAPDASVLAQSCASADSIMYAQIDDPP